MFEKQYKGLTSDKPYRSDKQIVRSWLAGHCSCTLVIPKDFARDYGLDKPSHVLLEKKENGILIRKLEV
jgi:hypothetical protein